jgi:hypothetical protein
MWHRPSREMLPGQPGGSWVRWWTRWDRLPGRMNRKERGNWACAAHRAGFSRPGLHGEILAEVEQLRESDLVRVIGSLAACKDADSELEIGHFGDIFEQEAVELGSMIGRAGPGWASPAKRKPGRPQVPRTRRPAVTCTYWPGKRTGMCSGISRMTPRPLEQHWAVPAARCDHRRGGFRVRGGFITRPAVWRSGCRRAALPGQR